MPTLTERLQQAKKSQMAYDGLALAVSLGLVVGGAIYGARKK